MLELSRGASPGRHPLGRFVQFGAPGNWEVPRVRFEQEERAVLLPLAPRPYAALLALPPTRPLAPVPPASLRPLLTVERRPLTRYAALAAAAAYAEVAE